MATEVIELVILKALLACAFSMIKVANIAREQAIFMLIYRIQEEVHRFTVGKVMAAKRSTMKHSSLEKIQGIGPSKAKKLLASFGTLAALKNASESEISAIKGISADDAHNVFEYFREKDKK